MSVFQALDWHEGEETMHKKLRVPQQDNPTVPTLSQQAISMLQRAPLIAVGTLDADGLPWTTVVGGTGPLSQALARNVIGIRAAVAARHDPVIEALLGKEATGEVVREEGEGRMIGGLAIDLETRKRVKLYGRMVAGALGSKDDEASGNEDSSGHTNMQLVARIDQSLGNCPKYLNKKEIVAAQASPELISDSKELPQEAIALLAKSDLFFMSTRHSMYDMDTNHRGGPPGFVRLLSNTKDGDVLVYPEYSGNRLYQSLGNLITTPLAGLCIPDFDTGDCLYITGTAEILFGADAAALLPRSNLAVKLTVTAARFVASVLPFRGTPGEASPYNPKVRYLATEQAPAAPSDVGSTRNTAKLLSQTPLTPSVSRFSFALSNPAIYTAGQYVTLDCSQHLDIGYSHMRNDDPRSLNDDFVRTFTVSSPPGMPPKPVQKLADDEFEITIRRVGVVTDLLFKHGLSGHRGQDFELDVKGFGGGFEVVQKSDVERVAFVAAGVGITPLLPCLPKLDGERFTLLWALRRDDLELAVDVLRDNSVLAKGTTLFVTGTAGEEEVVAGHLEWLTDAGIEIRERRIERNDIEKWKDTVGRFYVCTGNSQRRQLLDWLEGKEVFYEDYNF